jgi:hypothetical protein
LIEKIFGCDIASQPAPEPASREELHYVVVVENQCVQIVVKLRAGIPPFQAQHKE